MTYQKDLPQLYVLRTSKSHWCKSAVGGKAPMIYTERGALAALKNESRIKHAASDGPYEMVPITLVFGEPAKD